MITRNRKALRKYEVLQKFIAGIVLKGYEVKAIKEGKANLEGAFVKILDGKPYVVNMHIGRYSNQSQDVDPIQQKRSRQILLNEKEILKIEQETQQKGKTAVPLALLLQHNLIKLELAIVKGRKKYEKRHLEKERQIRKDLEISSKIIRG